MISNHIVVIFNCTNSIKISRKKTSTRPEILTRLWVESRCASNSLPPRRHTVKIRQDSHIFAKETHTLMDLVLRYSSSNRLR